MGPGASPDHSWAVPPQAEAEWLELQHVLDKAGPVACQTEDASAWWPDRYAVKGPAVKQAVASCGTCSAAQACLSYAVAADERYGIWGGTLPEERRAMRWILDS